MPPCRRHSAENDLQYGIRSTRRRTSYYHRGSSSLTHAQFMEQEIVYEQAEMFLHFAVYLGHQMSILIALFVAIQPIIDRYERMGALMSQAHASIKSFRRSILDVIKWISFLLQWIISQGEMALLYAEDLSVYVRRRKRFRPKTNRRLQDIRRDKCYEWFGLNPYHLYQLFVHLRVPESFRNPSNRQRFGGEECFIISMYHMIKGATFTSMTKNFGGDPRQFSTMHDLMIRHLYYTVV